MLLALAIAGLVGLFVWTRRHPPQVVTRADASRGPRLRSLSRTEGARLGLDRDGRSSVEVSREAEPPRLCVGSSRGGNPHDADQRGANWLVDPDLRARYDASRESRPPATAYEPAHGSSTPPVRPAILDSAGS